MVFDYVKTCNFNTSPRNGNIDSHYECNGGILLCASFYRSIHIIFTKNQAQSKQCKISVILAFVIVMKKINEQ